MNTVELKTSTFRRNRREFLKEAGLPVVLWTGSRVVGAAPGSSAGSQKCRVGYQIFGWGRHFPADWWAGARAVAGVGFHGIEGEYTISELYRGRESEFREKMDSLNLSLAALYSTTDLERPAERYVNIEKNLRAAEFCQKMGCETIVLGGTETQDPSPEDFEYFGEVANELGRRTLEEFGVRCGYHPHRGSLVETREQIQRIMELTNPDCFFLAPDTAHLAAGGSDPVEVFETFKDRIVHTHLKDYRPPQEPGGRGAFVPLGWGTVDFPKLISTLAEADFAGWHNVELDSARGLTQTEVATRARDYIEGVLDLSLDANQAVDRTTGKAD